MSGIPMVPGSVEFRSCCTRPIVTVFRDRVGLALVIHPLTPVNQLSPVVATMSDLRSEVTRTR